VVSYEPAQAILLLAAKVSFVETIAAEKVLMMMIASNVGELPEVLWSLVAPWSSED
jgi:hypothetical protein